MKQEEQENMDRVIRLMRLKRYEQPDAGFEARNLAAIRTRLAALPERRSWAQRWWGLFEQTPSPALRYALVTVFLALLGVHLLRIDFQPGPEPLSGGGGGAPAVVRTVTEPLQVAQTNLAPEPHAKPVFVFEYPASNRLPRGGMQYGSGPAVPVRYDY